MHLRLSQLIATARVLPRAASLVPLACVAAASVFACAFVVVDSQLVFLMRLAGAIVAATSASVLHDPSALTLASSPTPLAVRRAFRVVIAATFIAAWWFVMLAIAGVRDVEVATTSVTRELVALTALSVAGALAAQRLTGDDRGVAAGGFVAGGWFVLSLVPRAPWTPLPPDALSTAAARPLAGAVVAAVAVALALSRDPAARGRGRRALTSRTG